MIIIITRGTWRPHTSSKVDDTRTIPMNQRQFYKHFERKI